MEICEYIMCDGHQCQCVATVTVDGNKLCSDHADAMLNGIDPMDKEQDY
jgi:hypothetical protein